jgi:hypothetical protein
VAIKDPRVEPFAEWSDKYENPSEPWDHIGDNNLDKPDTVPQGDSQGADNHQTNQLNSGEGQHAAHIGGARAARAAFRTAMEAVINIIDS